MDELKTIIIQMDAQSDITLHSPLSRAPYMLFCLFLSIGYPTKQARYYTDKITYCLRNNTQYRHIYQQTNINTEEDI